MPVEAKNTGNENKFKEKPVSLKEQLNDMKSLLGTISNLKGTRPDREMFSVVVKKFIYTVATVPDNYFLSDVSDFTQELFFEFRIILGYLESSGNASLEKKLAQALGDVEGICSDIYDMYRDFLGNPGYIGTNFPKPKKIKAMRQIAGLVRDSGDVVILNREKKSRNSRIKDHVVVEMKEEPTPQALTDLINSFSMKYFQSDDANFNSKDHENTTIKDAVSPVDSTSTGSFNSDSNLLKSYDPPQAPSLYSEEVSSIKATNSLDSILVAAMGELLAPPPLPPRTRHGKIVYIDPITRRPSFPGSHTFKPPILVDEDGDILPANRPTLPTQLKSAAASIYESSAGPKSCKILADDDSFIMAYRQFALSEAAHPMPVEENKKIQNSEEMQSSGWSLKNRL